jgi:hypothetical protein
MRLPQFHWQKLWSSYAFIILSPLFNRLLKGLYFHTVVCGACRGGLFFRSIPLHCLLYLPHPWLDVLLHYCRKPHVEGFCHYAQRVLFSLASIVFPKFFPSLLVWIHINVISTAWLEWNSHVSLLGALPLQDHLGTVFSGHHSIQSMLPWQNIHNCF